MRNVAHISLYLLMFVRHWWWMRSGDLSLDHLNLCLLLRSCSCQYQDDLETAYISNMITRIKSCHMHTYHWTSPPKLSIIFNVIVVINAITRNFMADIWLVNRGWVIVGFVRLKRDIFKGMIRSTIDQLQYFSPAHQLSLMLTEWWTPAEVSVLIYVGIIGLWI